MVSSISMLLLSDGGLTCHLIFEKVIIYFQVLFFSLSLQAEFAPVKVFRKCIQIRDSNLSILFLFCVFYFQHYKVTEHILP